MSPNHLLLPLLFLGFSSVLSQTQRECECVDYWLCENGRIVTDGANLLDIRQKQCPGVEVCCLPDDDTSPQPGLPVVTKGEEPLTPFPDPITEPTPPPDTQQPAQIPIVASGGSCGRRRFPPGTDFKVTGSNNGPPERAFYGEAPWMVVLLRQPEGSQPIFTCGGTLITPQVVLTAAHCINGSAEEIQVRGGEYDNRVSNRPIPVQTVRASRVVVHPQYNSANLQNDIAVIFLETPMTLNEVVDVVCGPEGVVDVLPKGCFVTGWGRNSTFGRYQAVLSKVNLELRDRNYCQESLRKSRLGRHFRLHEGFTCAGGGDSRDTCTGDGGGPLVCPDAQDTNKLVQMGIVSWGIGCGEGYPTVLVSVKHYLTWISELISNSSL